MPAAKACQLGACEPQLWRRLIFLFVIWCSWSWQWWGNGQISRVWRGEKGERINGYSMALLHSIVIPSSFIVLLSTSSHSPDGRLQVVNSIAENRPVCEGDKSCINKTNFPEQTTFFLCNLGEILSLWWVQVPFFTHKWQKKRNSERLPAVNAFENN